MLALITNYYWHEYKGFNEKHVEALEIEMEENSVTIYGPKTLLGQLDKKLEETGVEIK